MWVMYTSITIKKKNDDDEIQIRKKRNEKTDSKREWENHRCIISSKIKLNDEIDNDDDG